ncbi:MAG TPA: hypothetical protein VNS81_00925 [Nocardioides sp.]|nr:hypothetical protein [Nocardioides sp.]
MIEVIGYVGSAGAAAMWVPQAARAVRHRHDPSAIAGISVASYVLAVGFNALLLAYGLTTHATPVAVAGVVNLVCSAVIVLVATAARASSRVTTVTTR